LHRANLNIARGQKIRGYLPAGRPKLDTRETCSSGPILGA
jgi:hypothetical protein